MSESGNQASLDGSTVTEQPTSAGGDEARAQNGILPGIEEDPSDSSSGAVVEESSQDEQVSSDGDNQGDGEGESLSQFGVEDDHRPNNPKLDNPDGDLEQDRRVNTKNNTEAGEQEQLFPDVEDDQMTLGGERARNRCLF
jgi:hypothetical protein